MNNGLKFLKVKVKTLAAEARFIRIEHQRAGRNGDLKQSLHNHKLLALRPEARATYVAYGLLRGRTLDQIEGSHHSEPDWKRVHAMIRKYGTAEDREKYLQLAA